MCPGKISKAEGIQADVVIIGGGGAGLPAAVTAAEAGAKKVIVLDKRKILGGCARLAMGMFAVESQAQQRLGLHYTADDLFKRLMMQSNWMSDARLVRTWFNGTKDLVRWLEEKGIVFDSVIAFTGSTRVYHQVARQPSMTGNVIMDGMVKECRAKGVQFLMETRARKLLTDEKGDVVGVLTTQNGKDIKISAKSVILATGSIAANKALLQKYYIGVNFENVKVMALPHSTGDGLLMAEGVGAAKDGFIGTLWMGPHNHPYNVHVGFLVRRPHGMWVNRYGVRFADESLYAVQDFGWCAGMVLERQPSRICYTIMDEKIIQDMINKRENVYGLEEAFGRKTAHDILGKRDEETGIEEVYESTTAWFDELRNDIQSEVKGGRVKVSNSWDGIAKWMGAEPAVLKETVDRYNMFCRNSYDADFLKPKEWLLPLTTPPYYAILAHEGLDNSIGGIRINHRFEVLNQALKPIGGLYSVGTAASGWVGPGYGWGGSELGFSVFPGYAAGKIAAEHAKSSGK